jgi:hypothetical protein
MNKAIFLAKYNHRCNKCKSPDDLELHHHDYCDEGRVVEILCNDCHNRAHGKCPSHGHSRKAKELYNYYLSQKK